MGRGRCRLRRPRRRGALPRPAARTRDDRRRHPGRRHRRLRRSHPQGRSPPRTRRDPGGGIRAAPCAAPGRPVRGAGHDRRRVPAVPLQRGHGRAGRGDLHERPGSAALLGGLAGRRVRPAAERGVRRLPRRAAGARRKPVRGNGREPGRRLQRPLGGDSGTDRPGGPLASGRPGALAPRPCSVPCGVALPRRVVPGAVGLQGDRDGDAGGCPRCRPPPRSQARGRGSRGAACPRRNRVARRPGRCVRLHLLGSRRRLVRRGRPGLGDPHGRLRDANGQPGPDPGRRHRAPLPADRGRHRAPRCSRRWRWDPPATSSTRSTRSRGRAGACRRRSSRARRSASGRKATSGSSAARSRARSWPPGSRRSARSAPSSR